VPKIAKRFLIFAASIALIFAVVLLCINLYLQSAGVQQRIRVAASKALGAPVTIRSTLYSPWGGLSLREISVPDPQNPAASILKATAVRIRFSLFPLLEKRFVVTECALFDPEVVIHQREEGTWVLPAPSLQKKHEVPSLAPAPTEEVPLPVASAPVPAYKAEIERFRLSGGILTFVDAKGRVVLKLDQATISAALAPDLKSATGDFDVENVNISNSLAPRKIHGPFTVTAGALDLPQIEGSLASGQVTAKYHLDLGPNPAFTLSATITASKLRRLAQDAGIKADGTEGKLNGTLDLKGDPRKSNSLTGKGNFELINSKIVPLDFIVQVGRLLGIDELQTLQLSEAKASLTIRDERVYIDDLTLKSTNLILEGSGPIKFSGKLDLKARLLVNKKIQQQLKGVLSDNFQATDDPEYRQLPFTVTGKASSPKTDLLDKLIGINLGSDMGGLFKNFFRSGAAPTPSPDAK